MEPFDYFDHAREETRMAEALAGESRKIADEALASEAVVDPLAVPEGVVCDGKGMCVLAEEPECIPDGMSRLQFWRGTRTHFVSDSAFSPARVSADMYLTGER